MIKKLRRRFALICSALTGAVVVAMAAVTLMLSLNQLEARYAAAFDGAFDEIVERLRFDSRISDDWLRRLERENDYCVFLSENGKPLFISSAKLGDESFAALYEKAAGLAEQSGVDDAAQYSPYTALPEADFELDENGGYSARARVVETNAGYSRVILLAENSKLNGEKHSLALTFALIALLALAAVIGVSFYLSARAVKPVERSLREQNEFIACASHELKSPLAVMRTGLSVARERGEITSLTPALELETDRLSLLVDDLLTLSRGDASRLKSVPEEVDLDLLLLEIFEALAPVAAKKRHTLKLDRPDGLLPKITTDRARLLQIIEILIDNAFEHTPAGSAVTLRAFERKRGVAVEVSDDGNGIPDDEKENVFKRFYRLEKSHTDKSHFGLGLSIAREFASLIGGTLTLRDSESGGASFVLDIK